MSVKKIQLVNAPLEPGYVESSRSGAYPPINLLALATYLHIAGCNYDIEILDGEILSFKELESMIDGDVVGFGTNILNYSTTLHLAKVAKENGAKVVLGGHYASALPRVILGNRSYVDNVIIGDGEEALYDILINKDVKRINNLAYRDDGNIKVNSIRNIPLRQLPILNFKYIDPSIYFSNFRKKYPSKSFKKSLAIYSAKGCVWRSRTGGCIYCGILHEGFRSKPPQAVWHEILSYVKDLGADFFWDVSDNITDNKKWLRQFVKSKPPDINPGFHLYARADHIDEEVAEYLCRINCAEVFIGAESGDDGCLANANKGYLAEQNLRAVEIIKKYDLNVVLSIMVGLPGESDHSVKNTWNLVKSIINIKPVEEAFVNILLPIPGSKSFEMILAHSDLRAKYENKDLFSLEELRRDWLETFCDISYEQAQKYRDNLLSLFPVGTSFGRPVSST